MRTPRIILEGETCAYHCVNRVVGREKLFTDAHKSRIQDIILTSVQLYGVNLINFVVMSNHIHILVQVPDRSSVEPLTRNTLFKLINVLYSKEYVQDLKQEFDRAESSEDPATTEWRTRRILDRYENRRANLSEFMKEVKQRITAYINKQYNRCGTLWEGRFKSPIVECTPEALLAVSTYIDLNPIRAGMVDRPEDYRWCGYAAALAGNKIARKGLCRIYACGQPGGKIPRWSRVHSNYRQYLFEKGIELLSDESIGFRGRKGFTAEEVDREIEQRGRLPLHEVLCHRVRYFSDGAVIGSAAFVNRVFEQQRDRLVSADSRRETGARSMRGANWGGLTTLRDLRVNVIGHPS